MNDHDTTAVHDQTTTEQPPPPQRRLVRLTEGAPGAGVAAGLGAYFGIDPVLVRIAFVVLAFAGGVGLILYLACWIAMPEGTPDDIGGRPPADPGETSRWVGIGLVVLAALLVVVGLPFAGPVAWAVVLIVAGVLLYRWDADRRSGGHAAPQAPTSAASAAPTQRLAYDGPSGAAPASASEPAAGEALPAPGSGTPPTPAPPPPGAPAAHAEPPSPQPPAPPPSLLGRATVGVGLVVLGAVALLDSLGALTIDAHHYVALALVVTGAGLLVGAWRGRARGLVVVGLLLIPLLVVTNAFGSLWGQGATVGEQLHQPRTSAQVEDTYRMLAGSLTIDLTELESGDPVAVNAGVAMGELLVLLPADADVTARSRAGVGEIQLPGQPTAGLNITPTTRIEGDGTAFDLDLRVGLGQIRVEVVESDPAVGAFDRAVGALDRTLVPHDRRARR